MLLLVFFAFSNQAEAQLYWRTDNTSANVISSNWSSSASGPFNQSYTEESNIIFTANSNINLDRPTSIANVNVTNASTVTVTRSAAINYWKTRNNEIAGAVRTFDIGSGSTLIWTNIGTYDGLSSAGTTNRTGFIKNGTGTWEIGAQTYNFYGGFTINAGTVIMGNNVNAVGAGPLILNGGSFGGTGTATRVLPVSSVTFGGDFMFGNVPVKSNSSVGLTFNCPVSLGSSTRTITVGGDSSNATSGAYTFNGVISGDSSDVGIIFDRLSTVTGRVVLGGANTYTGGTTIKAGLVSLGAAGVLADSGKIVLNGGTFSTGYTTGFSETVGTLDVASSSTIALGTGSHTLTFANSSGVTWAGSLLTITGWTGSVQTLGTAGKIMVGNGGLTQAQLNKIQFSGYSVGAMIVNGELVPSVTPTFSVVFPVCAGASLSALPTTSNNGITGTWSPSLNNTTTTEYTFTPTAGYGATTATLTITVNPNITPTFSSVSPICAGASLSALPTTSTNAINGTWSPSLNNTETTAYTFTPSSGPCISTASLTITVNPNVMYFADTDQDGFGDNANTTITCTGAPSGYVSNRTDCNDNNASINPAATEVFDGIDNNCNDQVDEGVYPSAPAANAQVFATGTTVNNLEATGTPITGYSAPTFNWYTAAVGGSSLTTSTVLSTTTYYVSQTINRVESARTAVAVTIINNAPYILGSYCGHVVSNIENTVYCTLVSGATKYRFMVTSPSSVSEVCESTFNGFHFLQLPTNKAFNTAYTVKCAVFVNGSWSVYGNSCSVTTPATPAPSKLIDAQCGSTLSLVDNTLYCGQSYGAQGFRFEVSSGGTSQTIDRSENNMQLSRLSGGVSLGTTYSVRVAVLYNGTYGAYGAACDLTTPASTNLTKVSATQCGSTLSNKWSVLYCGTISGATAYRFEWTNGGTTLTFNSSRPNMQLGNYTGWAVNTTYSVRVAALYNGVWQGYGSACNVKTPASMARGISAEATALTIKAVPNPFESEYVLMAQGGNELPVQVSVYDMLGKQVEQFSVEANELENRSLGSNLTSGIYNVMIAQGDEQQVVRIVKK